MKTKDFVKLVRAHARTAGEIFDIVENRGKGSHRMMRFGERWCSVPWNVASIPLGTRRTILKRLGIDPRLMR